MCRVCYSCIATSNTPSLPVMLSVQDALQLLSTHAQSGLAPYKHLRVPDLPVPCCHMPSCYSSDKVVQQGRHLWQSAPMAAGEQALRPAWVYINSS